MARRQLLFHIIGGIFPFITALVLSSPVSAAPFIEEVDPPVLRRGAVTRVTLRGEGLHQSVGVWTSLPTSPVSGFRGVGVSTG